MNRTGAAYVRAALESVLGASGMLLGENVGRLGGVYRITEGFLDRFGPERVVDTPVTERGTVALAAGLALAGRPVVVDLPCGIGGAAEALEDAALQAGPEWGLPLVVRVNGAEIPRLRGVRVAAPSRGVDAAAMIHAALASRVPTLLVEDPAIYLEVCADEPVEAPFSARTARAGAGAVVLTWGAGVNQAIEADPEVEVVDLRGIWPLDEAAVGEAVRRLGRVVVLGQGPGAEHVLQRATELGFLHLEAPPRLTDAAGLVQTLHETLNY